VSQNSNTQSPTAQRREGLLHHLFERIEGRVQSTAAAKTALDLEDIQGLILRGYRMPMVRHFLLKVTAPAAARKLIGRLVSGDEGDAPQITTAKDWHVGFAPGPGDDLTSVPRCKPDYCLNVGITWQGLLALEVKDHIPTLSFKSFKAFMAGAAARAELVGDTGISGPQHWIGGFGSGNDHVLVTLTRSARRRWRLTAAACPSCSCRAKRSRKSGAATGWP
jgi:hypothetical protein